MKKLAELKKKLADLKGEATKILDMAEARDGGELTADETDRYEAIKSDIDDTQASIERLEKLAEERRQMDSISLAGGTTVHDVNPAATGGFRDLAEFATTVRAAFDPAGGPIDRRLQASTTHQGGGGHGEGFQLPPQFRDDIWDLVTEFDEFGPLIDEEPTNRREVKIGADETTPWGATGVKAYWRAEGAQMSETELSDEGRTVPLHELYALVTATEELLEDSPRLASRITRKAAQAIAWKKNLAIVDGSGVGQPLGWMQSKALVTVAKESGQSADTIVALNAIKMFSRLLMVPGDAPFWLANSNTLPQLMTMTVGDRPIWMPSNGLAAAPGGFLLGYPVRLSEFAETVGDKGDIQLISPQGYYAARRSAGPQFASSMHLYFDYNKQAFRWTFRYGGQPKLAAPVTPAKSADTKSHFVTLAARG